MYTMQSKRDALKSMIFLSHCIINIAFLVYRPKAFTQIIYVAWILTHDIQIYTVSMLILEIYLKTFISMFNIWFMYFRKYIYDLHIKIKLYYIIEYNTLSMTCPMIVSKSVGDRETSLKQTSLIGTYCWECNTV